MLPDAAINRPAGYIALLGFKANMITLISYRWFKVNEHYKTIFKFKLKQYYFNSIKTK
jgi:hypothetical protein